MGPYQWFHFLNPLSIVVGSACLLSGLASKQGVCSKLNRLVAGFAYTSLFFGWLLMHHSVTMRYTDSTVMMYFADVGWLLLVPGILCAGGCTVVRLCKEKNRPAQIFFNILKNFLVRIGVILKHVVSIVLPLLGGVIVAGLSNTDTKPEEPKGLFLGPNMKRTFFPNSTNPDFDE